MLLRFGCGGSALLGGGCLVLYTDEDAMRSDGEDAVNFDAKYVA